MNLHRHRSTISFVVALLALSGNAIAAPADVSEDHASPAIVVEQASQSSAKTKEPIYLSLSHYSSAQAGRDLKQLELLAAPANYDEEFLDDLQEALSIELDALIDLQAIQ